MIKMRYRTPVILFSIALIFLLGYNYTEIILAENKVSISTNKEPSYREGDIDERDLARTIIIGDDSSYPPYSFIDENGKPAGFNVELAKTAAEAMGLNVRIKLGDWTEIRSELETGKIDAISGMFYSKAGRKSIPLQQKIQ